MTPSGAGGVLAGRWRRDLRSTVGRHRRLLSAGLLAGSVALGLHALAPPPPPSSSVVVAGRDLPAGARLGPGDLAVARLDPAAVPDGSLRSAAEAAGRTLVSAARRGEPLTDVRLVGPTALGRLGPGQVAVPVRVADPASVRLVRPGDMVDVLAAGAEGAAAPARLVAAAARVLTVPGGGSDRFGPGGDVGGGLVLLATTAPTAARLAGAAVTERLSLVLRGG